MKTADLKTDGTVYKAVVRYAVSQSPNDSDFTDVVLLDLNGDTPRDWMSRYENEKRPIKARIVKDHRYSPALAGEIVWISARRVVRTVAEHEQGKVLAAQAKAKADAEKQARIDANKPLADELNELQVKLGLAVTKRDYQGNVADMAPLVRYTLNRHGTIDARYTGNTYSNDELTGVLDTLRQLAATTDLVKSFG